MPRSGEQVRRRLQQAAVELAARRGYDAVTASEIAAAAGVTERTFFRHFPDKREALFDGEAEVASALRDAVAEAEPASALALAQLGMQATVPLVQATRAFAEPRHRVIAATPALAERALAKEAVLTSELAAALQDRGVPADAATLAARVAIAGFVEARRRWLEHPDSDLASSLGAVYDDLRTLL